MTRAGALAAFVAGAWVLQQQAELPDLFASCTGAGAALALLVVRGVRAWRAPIADSAREPAGEDPRSLPGGFASLARSSAPTWLRKATTLAGALLLGFSLAAVRAHARLADQLAFADEGRDLLVTGVVASLPAILPRGVRFEFDVQEVSPRDVRVPARISLGWFAASAHVRPGELWRLPVRLKRPHGTFNPGGFDLEAWMFERDLRAAGYVREAQAWQGMGAARLQEMTWGAAYVIDRLRDGLRERLRRVLADQRYGGVLVALVLGDQRSIREEDWLLFNRTGISHLVSISGLHITMIAGLVAAACGLAWRRFPRTLRAAPAQTAASVAAVAAGWAYCMLAGWGIPAQRTFFMLAAVAVATMLRVASAPALTLALAAFAVTLLDPWAVLAPGFWLSFGAVAAILLAVSGRMQRARGAWAWLREAGRLQLAVTVALVPLTVALFQQVSLVTPLANALAIPVVSLLVTPLALAASALVSLPEPFALAATPLLTLAHVVFAGLAEILRWMSSWPGAAVSMAAPPSWATALGIAGAAWLIAPPGWPARWAGVCWLLPLFAWPAERPRDGELWVTALDVGQGMAVVIEEGERVLVYDTGPRYASGSDAGSRIVLPYLRHRGIGRIDLLVVSHLDSDHSGGARSILAAMQVGRVLTSIEPDHPVLAGAQNLQRCVAGAVLAQGAARLHVLHPTAADYEGVRRRDTNALSCVLGIEWGGTRVLLTGDLPGAKELELVRRTTHLDAELLMAPHHGSKLSSSEPFVRAVAPTWVLVQAGYRSRFGHPDPAVVDRYRRAGATVVRTDEGGAIRWRVDRQGMKLVWTMRLGARRYWHNQPKSRPDTAVGEGAPTEMPAAEMPAGDR